LLKIRLVYVVWALLVAASIALAVTGVHAGDPNPGGGGRNIIMPLLL
jgi:hypothetical protein